MQRYHNKSNSKKKKHLIGYLVAGHYHLGNVYPDPKAVGREREKKTVRQSERVSKCVCVCVCVRERERERERERDRERQRERDRQTERDRDRDRDRDRERRPGRDF